MISGSTSVTRPRSPSEPSSVVMVSVEASRLSSSTPKSFSSVAAPDDDVDAAAALAQLLGQHEQRR